MFSLEVHEMSSSLCQRHFQQQIKLTCAFCCTKFQGGCDLLLCVASSIRRIRDTFNLLTKKSNKTFLTFVCTEKSLKLNKIISYKPFKIFGIIETSWKTHKDVSEFFLVIYNCLTNNIIPSCFVVKVIFTKSSIRFGVRKMCIANGPLNAWETTKSFA